MNNLDIVKENGKIHSSEKKFWTLVVSFYFIIFLLLASAEYWYTRYSPINRQVFGFPFW